MGRVVGIGDFYKIDIIGDMILISISISISRTIIVIESVIITKISLSCPIDTFVT
jgi:hypothetical protein